MRTIANMDNKLFFGKVRLEKDSDNWIAAEIIKQENGLYCAKIGSLILCDISEGDIKLNS